MAGDFIDLIAWQDATRLAAVVIEVASRLRGPGCRDTASQMLRSAESIPAYIAEGHGRGLGRDCIRFLRTARASAAELESHLRVARLSHRLDEGRATSLIDHVRRTRFLIQRLLRSLESRTSSRR
jgi:four helix bundle protein